MARWIGAPDPPRPHFMGPVKATWVSPAPLSHHELTSKVKQLNTATLAFRRKRLDAEAADIDQAINTAIETKSYNDLDDIQSRLDKLADEKAFLDREEENSEAADKPPEFRATAAGGLRRHSRIGSASPRMTTSPPSTGQNAAERRPSRVSMRSTWKRPTRILSHQLGLWS
jgi:hypothetical protein